jgi:hypothetical protein
VLHRANILRPQDFRLTFPLTRFSQLLKETSHLCRWHQQKVAKIVLYALPHSTGRWNRFQRPFLLPKWSKKYIYVGGRLLATEAPNGSGELIQYHYPDRLKRSLSLTTLTRISFTSPPSGAFTPNFQNIGVAFALGSYGFNDEQTLRDTLDSFAASESCEQAFKQRGLGMTEFARKSDVGSVGSTGHTPVPKAGALR